MCCLPHLPVQGCAELCEYEKQWSKWVVASAVQQQQGRKAPPPPPLPPYRQRYTTIGKLQGYSVRAVDLLRVVDSDTRRSMAAQAALTKSWRGTNRPLAAALLYAVHVETS